MFSGTVTFIKDFRNDWTWWLEENWHYSLWTQCKLNGLNLLRRKIQKIGDERSSTLRMYEKPPQKIFTNIILSRHADFVNWVDLKREHWVLWIAAALWFQVSTNSLRRKDKLVGFEKLFARQNFLFFFSIWKEIFISSIPKNFWRHFVTD